MLSIFDRIIACATRHLWSNMRKMLRVRVTYLQLSHVTVLPYIPILALSTSQTKSSPTAKRYAVANIRNFYLFLQLLFFYFRTIRLLRGFLFAFALSLETSRTPIRPVCSLCETCVQFYPRDGDVQHCYINPLLDLYTDLSFCALFSNVLPCEDIYSDVDVGTSQFSLVCERQRVLQL